DPFGGSYQMYSPQSFNRNSYVGDDPINAVDPLGLLTICFLNFKDISNGDGPPRWRLTDVSCIALPDFEPLREPGERGAGGAAANKPRQARKKGLTNKECQSLLRQIYDRAVELYNRRVDFIKDKFHLVIPGNKDPLGGDLRGHIEQFE